MLDATPAGDLLDRLKLTGPRLLVEHLQPPADGPVMLLGVAVHDEDAAGAGTGDHAHVVAARVLAALTIPTLEGEVGRKLMLQRAPLWQRGALPLLPVLAVRHRWHDLEADATVHARPLVRLGEIWIERGCHLHSPIIPI